MEIQELNQLLQFNVDTFSNMPLDPKNILLIKSHSMGIGDLLRSSAAWLALKEQWPEAKLHLLMLSKHAGYPSEELIRSHYLLASATFITVKAGHPGLSGQKNLAISTIFSAIETRLKTQEIYLIIDCEPFGIKTSLVARRIGRLKKALTVGIAQFPLRKYFYDLSAPALKEYIKSNHLELPLDYTERDFVALAALGVARKGRKIIMQVTREGLDWQKKYASQKPANNQKIVTLNIGCGTADALNRRPPMPILVACMASFYKKSPFTLWLSGADFEREINVDFADAMRASLKESDLTGEILDWSGQCSLSQLTGLLSSSDLVISTDSGPYHMAVALGVPTLCWFNIETPAALHRQKNVTNLVLPAPAEFAEAAHDLIHA